MENKNSKNWNPIDPYYFLIALFLQSSLLNNLK